MTDEKFRNQETKQFGRFGRIYVRIWTDEVFEALSQDARMGWIYLLSCPQASALPGLFVLRTDQAAAHLKMDPRRVASVLKELELQGLMSRDEQTGLVWLPRAIAYDAPANSNVVKAWPKYAVHLPECELKEKALDVLWAHPHAHGIPRPKPPKGGRKPVPRTVSDTVPDTVQETVPQTVPDTVPQTVPDTVRDTQPEGYTNPFNIHHPTSNIQPTALSSFSEKADAGREKAQKGEKAEGQQKGPPTLFALSSPDEKRDLPAILFEHWRTLAKKNANTRLTPELRKKLVASLKIFDEGTLKQAIGNFVSDPWRRENPGAQALQFLLRDVNRYLDPAPEPRPKRMEDEFTPMGEA